MRAAVTSMTPGRRSGTLLVGVAVLGALLLAFFALQIRDNEVAAEDALDQRFETRATLTAQFVPRLRR